MSKKYASCDDVIDDAEKMLAYVKEAIAFYSDDESIRQEHTQERCDAYVKKMLKVRDALQQAINACENVQEFQIS